MNDLKIRIRKLREFVRYTQADLADELGMSQSAYHKLENGPTRLDLERLNQLTLFYELPLTTFYKKTLRYCISNC